jgi:hypothetical protein
MASLPLNSMPCAVCGVETHRHQGWYLIADDRWRDRLRIFTWSGDLASEPGLQSACSRPHLKMLIACWLDQASLRLAHGREACSASAPLGPGELSAMETSAQFVGDLSIFRDDLSRGWTGSAEAFDAIVDALIPVENAVPVQAPPPLRRIPELSHTFSYEVSLQKAPAGAPSCRN